MSFLPSILILGLVAIAAAFLAHKRQSRTEFEAQRHAASRALAVATAIQAVHFAEELATGFHVRFPALFGVEPMPVALFGGFNVAWLIVWAASVPVLRKGHRLAFFTAWFLAIAAVLNAVAHPAMALASNGYFPGLISSPLIGLAGFVLWRKLLAATT